MSQRKERKPSPRSKPVCRCRERKARAAERQMHRHDANPAMRNFCGAAGGCGLRFLAIYVLTAQGVSRTKDDTPPNEGFVQTMRTIDAFFDELRECTAPGADFFTGLTNAVNHQYPRRMSKKARYRPKVYEKKLTKKSREIRWLASPE